MLYSAAEEVFLGYVVAIRRISKLLFELLGFGGQILVFSLKFSNYQSLSIILLKHWMQISLGIDLFAH